jgi:hypothetical protein
MGLRAWVVSLKSKYAETCKTGAGNVLAEVWLSDYNKWAFRLVNRKGEIPKKERKRYLQFIPHYLYFFDTKFLNRRNLLSEDRYLYKGKDLLILVPKGAKHPKIFQRKFDIGNVYYTNSASDFYRRP